MKIRQVKQGLQSHHHILFIRSAEKWGGKQRGWKVHFRDLLVLDAEPRWSVIYIFSYFFFPFLLSIQGIDRSNIVQRHNSGN